VNNLKPYPSYQPFSLPEVAAVPSEWTVCRIKNLFREHDERSGDGTGELLSLTRNRGIVPQREATTRPAAASDLSNYKRCMRGDLVMNRMQAWSGMFAVSPYDGLVSPDYTVLKSNQDVDPHFFERLFKSPPFVDEFSRRSKGIGSGFNRLYTDDFGSVPAFWPPFDQQSAIVRFLRYLEGQIWRLALAKQKLVGGAIALRRDGGLIGEFRTRLILDVGTGQLDARQAAAQLPDTGEPRDPEIEVVLEAAEDEVVDAE
jgi:type I restriction enzyme, S subunit